MPRPFLASLFSSLLLASVLLGAASGSQPVKAGEGQDFWATRGCPAGSDRCQWFRDAKFGAIIHFGVYSELGGYYQGQGPYRPAEQIMGLGDRRATIVPEEYLKNVAAKFNPTGFDADEWVRQMKAAGQRYAIITTKHHDGFCMFDTATTDFDVIDATPFKRDIVRELADACRRHELPFCLYYSIGDWSAKQVMNSRFADYGAYMRAQLQELLTNYGDIDVLWFDNYWYVDDQYVNDDAHARGLYNYVRQLRPGILVNDRCGAGVSSTHGDYATPENQLKGALQTRCFEVVMTCTADDNWGWVRDATNYREPGEIVRNIVDSASKGGNFVLNIGPNGEGRFPAPQRDLLAKVGDWTTRNAEALYGTTPAPEVEFSNTTDAYATRSADGKTIYLHIARWPAEGGVTATLPAGGTPTASMVDDRLPSPAVLFSDQADRVRVSIDRPAKPDNYLTVIKLTR